MDSFSSFVCERYTPDAYTGVVGLVPLTGRSCDKLYSALFHRLFCRTFSGTTVRLTFLANHFWYDGSHLFRFIFYRCSLRYWRCMPHRYHLPARFGCRRGAVTGDAGSEQFLAW